MLGSYFIIYNKMKYIYIYIIITLFVFFIGCLTLPAPHVFSYVPIKSEIKNKYIHSNSNIPYLYLPYFYLKTIENETKMFSSLEIISLDKLKTIRIRIRIDKNNEQLQFDSVILQTSKMHFKMEKTILHKDSVFNEEYLKQIKMSDRIWNKQIGNLKDSILVKIFVKNEIYDEEYYYDGK